MTSADALADTFFSRLENLSPDELKEAREAVGSFTMARMYSLNHIPARYYVMEELRHYLPRLYKELEAWGYILLDRDQQPICISGRRPAMWAALSHIHGPWKEEPC